MRNAGRFSAVALAILFSLSIASPNRVSAAAPVNANQDVAIPTKDIPVQELAALHGSAEAALRLAQYHDYLTHDYAASLYWTQIAAENGSPVAMQNYAFKLRRSNDPRDRRRAEYWDRKAK